MATPLFERIENDFTYHPPNDAAVVKHEKVRHYGASYAKLLLSQCPPESRELSLALTRLEEAVMWANAAIARNN